MQRILIFTLIFGLLVSCQKEKAPKKTTPSIDAKDMKVDSQGLSSIQAIIKTIHGNIIFKFFPKRAPNTVTRIIELANMGFYDGLTFHRVVPGFVIQGGDPTGTGTSGSGKNLKAEFNQTKHIKGSVAMARSSNPDSADSQFYIALDTVSQLDGKYTVFGQVIEGLDVIDKVVKGDKMLSIIIQK